MDMVYLDLSKALDPVSHSILPEKLAVMGAYLLGKKLAGWLGPESGSEWSYLQLVATQNGVPQGPVLRPVLLDISTIWQI